MDLGLIGGREIEYKYTHTILFKMKKTSKEWLESIPAKHNLEILDPIGWDSGNYNFSFNEEKIEKEEFDKRIDSSTIQCDDSFLIYS